MEMNQSKALEDACRNLRPLAFMISGTTRGRYLGVVFVQVGSHYGLYSCDDTFAVHRASC